MPENATNLITTRANESDCRSGACPMTHAVDLCRVRRLVGRGCGVVEDEKQAVLFARDMERAKERSRANPPVARRAKGWRRAISDRCARRQAVAQRQGGSLAAKHPRSSCR
eukprot:1078665-Rhodomonas_salina.2